MLLQVQQAMLHVQQAMLHVHQAMLHMQQAMLHVQHAKLSENNNKANLSPAELELGLSLVIINESRIKIKSDLKGMNPSTENKLGLSTGLTWLAVDYYFNHVQFFI